MPCDVTLLSATPCCSGLSTALAGLRGEAPLVTVRFEIVNDRPLAGAGSISGVAPSERRSSSASEAGSDAQQQQQRVQSGSEAGPGPGSGSAAGQQQQCSRSGWACKLGFCK